MTTPPANYYDDLPTALYGQPITQTLQKINKHQNVLLTGILGAGRETFLKMLLKQLNPAIAVTVWDMQLPQSIKSLSTSQADTVLVLNKLFLLKNRAHLLEQLHNRQLVYPNLTVVALTDHTGITSPQAYFAKTHQFFQAVYHIMPFDEAGTKTMIEANRKFYNWTIPQELAHEIHNLTGGIARLIKYVCNEINENHISATSENRFIQNPAILFQLKYLYELLFNESKDQLKELQILDSRGRIRARLLRHYLKEQTLKKNSNLKQVLTQQEQVLFNYFLAYQNHSVSIDKIADLLAMTDDNFSLWKIYKLISRLKPKLKPHYDLKANRGVGYTLITTGRD